MIFGKEKEEGVLHLAPRAGTILFPSERLRRNQGKKSRKPVSGPNVTGMYSRRKEKSCEPKHSPET